MRRTRADVLPCADSMGLALDPIGAGDLPRSPWDRLRSFLGLERRELWVVVVYAVVIGGLTLATPIAVQALVNTVAFGSVLQPLIVLTVLLFGGLAFASLLGVLEAYVVEVLQRRVFVRIAEDFGRRLPSIDTSVLDVRHGPDMVNRFFDVLTIQKSLSVLLLDGLGLTLQVAIGMVLLAFYHPWLLAFDVVLVVLLVIVLALGRGATATGTEESRAKYRTAAWLEDVIAAAHLFRGERAARHAAQRTEMLCRAYLRARRAHFRILLRQIAGGYGLQLFAMVALLGVGGWLVIARQLTLGQLVASELVIAAMGAGFVKLGKNLEKAYDLAVGVGKVATVVDAPVERRGGDRLPDGGAVGCKLRGAAVDRGGREIFGELDFEVRAQERVAVLGASGSGKSTLLDLLAGLRLPTRGSVQIDGLDMRRADLVSVRDRVSLVRGAELVTGSVLDNLRLGDPDLDEPSARRLLRLLDLEAVVDVLPAGLDTQMLPSGAPLSETQARRLALVRALAARPRLLLLDRALDRLGLEGPAYKRLLDALFADTAPWTLLVVTDDPVVALRCGRVLRVVDGGVEVVS